jgi:adenosylcobinamide amidohydrolase
MPGPLPTIDHRNESGHRLPILVWRFEQPVLGISSAIIGGGVGPRSWAINASVSSSYDRSDPDVHLEDLAGGLGLIGAGVGMLTAVDVTDHVTHVDGDVVADATVGLGHPSWAAAPDGDKRDLRPGTINLMVWIPVVMSPAALVNTVITATEAKAQALWDHGLDATGTGSDAIFIACPSTGPVEAFGGPRSIWGARLARAVHTAVYQGAGSWLGPSAHTHPSPW